MTDRLLAIAGRFFELPNNTVLAAATPPFDTSQPNFHNTKAEFQSEMDFVLKALENVQGLFGMYIACHNEKAILYTESKNVSDYIDSRARRYANKRPIENPVELVNDNAIRMGLTLSTLYLLSENRASLLARKQELESQEAIFWSGKGRAPNHYARTIALRFAKLIAQKTGKKPTFGTSRDGAHPSTEFGRALEEIFEVLGIEATVKHPAVWAIKQLTEEDLKPEFSGIIGALRAQPKTKLNDFSHL